jgi:hypothetical protein
MAAGRAGRTSKLNAGVRDAITEAVALGLPLCVACDGVGVSYTAVKEWVQRGENRHPTRKPTRAHVAFAAAIKRARAADQGRRLKRLEEAARGGQVVHEKTTVRMLKDGTQETVTERRSAPPVWQVDAWCLERRSPEHWSLAGRDIRELRGKLEQLEALLRGQHNS